MDQNLNLTISLRDRLSAPFSSTKGRVLMQTKEMSNALSGIGLTGEQSFKRLDSFHEDLTRKMGNRFSSFKSKTTNDFRDISGLMSGMGSMGGFGNMLGAATPWLAAGAGIAAIGEGVSKLITVSREWEKGMAEVNLTAGLNPKELDGLSAKIKSIAKDIPVDLEGAPQAFNKIISAGLTTNEALAALKPTLLASKAGFTDMETTAMAGTRVMKATGLDITTVYDKLFQVVRAGNATFQDVAQYMPRLIPASQALGVSFNDVSGAFATLTTSMSSEQSATSLQNIFTALGRSQIRKNLKDIGVDVYDSAGKMRGFGDIIGDLKGKLNGLTSEQKAIRLGNLGFDQEAFNGFAALTEKLGELNKNIGLVSTSQGSLSKAVDDTKQKVDEETVAWNRLKAAMEPTGNLFSRLKNAYITGLADLFEGKVYNKKGEEYARKNMPILSTIWDMVTPGLSDDQKKFREKQYAAQRRKEATPQLPFSEYDLLNKTQVAPGLSMIALPKPAQSGMKLPSAMAIKTSDKPAASLTADEIKYSEGKTGKSKSESTSPSTTIVGAAAQPKNITINIESFIKGFTMSNKETNNMTADQLQRYFIDMFMGVTRYAENQI